MVDSFIKQVVIKRKSLKISQEELAEKLGISTVTMSAIENAETTMDLDMCLKVTKILDIPLAEIFKSYMGIENENGKKNHYRWLAGIIVVLLIANICLEVGLMWYENYVHYNFMNATVVAIEGTLLEVKNHGTLGCNNDDVYRIKLNKKHIQMCGEIGVGDVVRVHYFVKLCSKWDNASWQISEIVNLNDVNIEK